MTKVKENIAPTVIQSAKISIGLMPNNYGKNKLVFISVMVVLLCLVSWSQTAWAAPCTVTNTNDSGAGSLRDCITVANGSPGTTISFNIPNTDSGYQTAGSNHWWRIQPASQLPTITANNTIIDGTTQTTNQGDTNAAGPEIEIFGNGASFNALNITSANNTVKGLIIGGFSGGNGCGIFLSGSGATGNTIAGNYLGTDYIGTAAQANYRNIWLYNGANANTIGGTTAADRNVISGATNGFYITEAGTDNNIIRGNYIGTNAAGTAALGNQAGIYIYRGAKSTIIGGAIAGAGNVISGNTIQAISIYGNGTDSHVIQGNYIGTDATGMVAVPNQFAGFWIGGGAKSTTIGGADPLARNVISGNTSYGLYIENAGTDNHVIQGNYIGLAADGATKIANNTGISIRNGAKSFTIGGAIANAGNVISGNSNYGIYITDAGTSNHLIQGNYIGLNAAGTAAVGNNTGIYIINSATTNTIGGTNPLARNVVSGNTNYGILISGTGTDGNFIQGNYIGTNAAGTAALANPYGVSILTGAKSTTVGGTNPLARNVISGNVNSGIYISDSGTDGHLIQGNYIGTDPAGMAKIANIVGITIENGAKSTNIGGADPLARNVISGNTAWGVFIGGAGTDSHLIQGNYIGTNAAGTGAIANLAGIFIWNGAKSNTIGGTDPLARNVISGNSNYGILIKDPGTDGHIIQGNYIGLDATGTAAMGNTLPGVYIFNSAKSTTIGGTASGAANRIAYNGDGISIKDVDTDGNVFSANSIFENTGLGIKLGGDGSNNNKAAPTITTITPGGSDFIITATVPAAGDTIQFFRANNTSSPAVTPDSPAGEGYLFLGSCVDNGAACVGPYVSGSDTDAAAGAVSVTLTGGGLAIADTLSATATDAVNGTSQFSVNKIVSLQLIKQTYDTSNVCIASSDATDVGCGSTSVVTVPAGLEVKFMIIVKNTSAQTVSDVRFQDILDESAGGFSYITGSMSSTPVGASAPADTASNAVLYSSATNTLTDNVDGDIGSARDLVNPPLGVDNISIGLPINAVLSINAHKSFAVIFQVRKK